MKTRNLWILAGIFLAVLCLRLVLAFRTPYFEFDSYGALRQVTAIEETWRPLRIDNLGYGGRELSPQPFYDYILAFGKKATPLALKILPNLFISLLVIIAFVTARRVTKNDEAALIAAFAAGFVPMVFQTTIYSLSPLALATPLLFLCLYFFIDIDKEHALINYLLCFLILALISPLVFVLVIGLLLYLFIAKLERFPTGRAEVEVALFSTFFSLWLQFVIHKKPILHHGLNMIWQNVPKSLLGEMFFNLSFLDSINRIGLLPFLCGLFIVYRYLFKEKNRVMHLFISLALSLGVLLTLKLMPLMIGLCILGVLLTLLFAVFLDQFFGFIEKTKVRQYHLLFFIGIISLFIISSVLPALLLADRQLAGSVPGPDEIAAMSWLKANAKGAVAAPLNSGFLIEAVAERPTIADRDFLMAPDVQQRLSDIDKTFTTPHKTDALALLEKYGASYLYAPPDMVLKDTITASDCFQLVFDRGAMIYKATCRLGASP
ncbi:MAG: hypothetical protein V1735_05320 [Nanoarchaeota archaeon]